jgi:predicted RNA methylase
MNYLEELVLHHSQKLNSQIPTEIDLIRMNSFKLEFDAIYDNINIISYLEKNEQNTAGNLLYGEIEFEPFTIILETIKLNFPELLNEDGIFFDIGSGSGKAVLAAALFYSWKKCIGIEINLPLVECATIALNNFKTIPIFVNSIARTDIVFENTDAFDTYDYGEANLIFVNSTALNDEYMKKLSLKLSNVKNNSILITTTVRSVIILVFLLLYCFY